MGLVGESGSSKSTTALAIVALLAEPKKEYGLAKLFISHDLAVVGQVAGRVAVMRNGLIVEEGPSLQMLTASHHRYT